MKMAHVSALKVLVLLVCCSMVSSVRAAPSTSPECTMSAEGCITGLAATIDPYCENDPGHHPDYDDDYGWPDTPAAYPCGDTAGAQLDIVCAIQHKQNYWQHLEDADEAYRHWVCACYSEVPALPPAKLAKCLSDADAEYQISLQAARILYQMEAADCCVVQQRPANQASKALMSVLNN